MSLRTLGEQFPVTCIIVAVMSCSPTGTIGEQDISKLPAPADWNGYGQGDWNNVGDGKGGDTVDLGDLGGSGPRDVVFGSWCGPVNSRTQWLTFLPLETATCGAHGATIFPAGAVDDGLSLELPASATDTIPTTVFVSGTVCADGTCENVSGSLSLTHFTLGTSLEGSLDLTGGPGAALGADYEGSFAARSCDFDDTLPIAPDGNDLVAGLDIAEIAVYQTVKVRVMSNMQEETSRPAPVVTGRGALVRVFVAPQSGFAEPAVNVVLKLYDSQEEIFTDIKEINVVAASTEEALGSTANFVIPAQTIDFDTRYSVALVPSSVDACAGGSTGGNTDRARFPVTGSVSFAAVSAGTLEVVYVPIVYVPGGDLAPETGATALASYDAELAALYPAETISTSLHAAVGWDGGLQPNGTGWAQLLAALTNLRDQDGVADDIYYYGLVRPTATLSEFCGSGCVAGIANYVSDPNDAVLRAGFGLSFGGDQGTTMAAGTFAHELGHLHGRQHAPCGNAANVDPSYPYTGGAVSVWGFDMRIPALLPPTGRTDIMGYCQDTWLSDYNYDALVQRMRNVNGLAYRIPPSDRPTSAAWGQLILEEGKDPVWGPPVGRHNPHAGEHEQAVVYDEDSRVIERIDVRVIRIDDLDGAKIAIVPEPDSRWSSVAVGDSAPARFDARNQALLLWPY